MVKSTFKRCSQMRSTPEPNTSVATNREAIYLALMTVPAGKVITYGQLASLAGLPGAARLAGSTLSSLPAKTQLPWHRVINAQGKISLPVDSIAYKKQVQRLQAEGVEVKNGKISLRIYGYNDLIAPSI
ncbi:MAG TPA: MGMT family protein [Cellvibrio sp.]|nr:MGMT family protein [Cellvibrio sp.]